LHGGAPFATDSKRITIGAGGRNVSHPVHLLLASALIGAGLLPQSAAPPTTTTTFYAVSYVEVGPSSRPAAIAAFARYRDAAKKEHGYGDFELFEQLGRRGHFAVVETWSDQKAFDGRDASLQTQLLGTLDSMRVGGYDQRPYKVLTIGSPSRPPSRDAIVVVTHVDTSPSPQVPELLQRLAEASRRDEGNLRFDVVQHTMRANHFTVIEAWRSEQALEAHAAAAHTRQYRDELQPLTGSPLDERVYKQVE